MKAAKPEPPVTIADAEAVAQATKSWYKRRGPLLIGLVTCLAIAGGAAAYGVLHHSGKTVVAAITPKPTASATPTPTPAIYSPLTGLPVTSTVAAQPVVGVIIENQTEARPQSGLSAAGVVYEANAEGGITRFEAFYQDAIPTVMGPVRSLRTYFLDWGLEFNAPVAHAGGNADALDEVGPLGMKDINALYGGPSQFFYRSTDRYAPHNLYTSNPLLTKALTTYGFGGASTYTPSPRKADSPMATPAHPNIHLNFSYDGYQVDYAYTAATNDYARNLAGAPHIDRNTGQQIHVKNIVVEYMPTSYGYTRLGEQTVIMGTVGSGKAVVMRDGDAVEGTWTKPSRTARTTLTDASGAPIALDRGNTWYEIIPVGNSISY